LSESNITTYADEMNAYYETAKKDIVSSLDFIPKTSITLDESLIFNVYIPADTSLVKFTLDGVEYTDFDALVNNMVTVGEKSYYLISISLSAKDAARDIPLTATLNVNENTLTGKYTLSIPKYAKTVLADGSDVERQLVRDILSYVRAASLYFAPEDTETVEKIDAVIGVNYDVTSPVTVEGSSVAPSVGLSSATFALNSTPALKFYIDGSAPAKAYEFYVGGRKVKGEVGNDGEKTYIILNVYAYQMCETVTYTINGAEASTFHINAYYEWAKTQNNEALVKLVERFWKYCQSARDFKNSIVEA
jgi:hypothetical protein